jgi:MFS family permease
VIAVALVALGLGPTDGSYAVNFLAPLVLLGLGAGLFFPSLTIIAMADATESDAGLASGLLNTTGQVGGALGLAILATVAGARTVSQLNDGAGSTAALASGYHLAWLIGAGTVVITLALAVYALRTRTAQQIPVDDAGGEAVA